MRSRPNISVVIPCYNGERYLRETLDSVLSQTLLPREIIVVDDGSTDDSAAIASSMGTLVRVVQQENQGESVARNRGVEEASGSWIAFLDADDRWEPGKLLSQVERIEADVVAVHTDVYVFGDYYDTFTGPPVTDKERYSLDYILANSPLHPSSLMVRKVKCPKFRTHIRHGEDLIFQLDLVRMGKIVHVPCLLTGYRKHAESQICRTEAIQIFWFQAREEWLAENRNQLGDETVARLRRDAVLRLIKNAHCAKWNRRWNEYWKIRGFIFDNCQDVPAARKFCESTMILPPGCYAAKDVLHRTGRRILESLFRGTSK